MKIIFSILTLISAIGAFAQSPANDLCANAIHVGPGNTNGNNSGAMTNVSSCLAGEVWYSFTASGTTASITATPVTQYMDLTLALYDSCGAGAPRTCQNNGYQGDGESIVSIGTVAGQTYYIAVGGVSGGYSGYFMLGIAGAEPVTGIVETPDLPLFDVSYNATARQFVVRSEAGADPLTVDIYNMAGQRKVSAVSGSANSGDMNISAADLAPGVYIVSVRSLSGTLSKRVVII